MPPKKRRRENSVVRTEPDRRRATGAEDDDEIKTEGEDEDLWSRKYSTLGMTRYRREKAKRQKSTQDATFPFLKLPAEIRIMVYRCLVVSKAETSIDLSTNKTFVRGGIETAILTASRLVRGSISRGTQLCPTMTNSCRSTMKLSRSFTTRTNVLRYVGNGRMALLSAETTQKPNQQLHVRYDLDGKWTWSNTAA